jgi:hypothetical protein
LLKLACGVIIKLYMRIPEAIRHPYQSFSTSAFHESAFIIGTPLVAANLYVGLDQLRSPLNAIVALALGIQIVKGVVEIENDAQERAHLEEEIESTGITEYVAFRAETERSFFGGVVRQAMSNTGYEDQYAQIRDAAKNPRVLRGAVLGGKGIQSS